MATGAKTKFNFREGFFLLQGFANFAFEQRKLADVFRGDKVIQFFPNTIAHRKTQQGFPRVI